MLLQHHLHIVLHVSSEICDLHSTDEPDAAAFFKQV